ncbi:uncharacterized protein HRG_02110 [Hirsutella rhossiliensis]|uniref:Uncharacterized protein n=1 Tax=Hirsutella rhossiliensis TaxID=111463 RepID=A0A9P8N665_9HYPO|nr:uncharacterized protein HRG_02110 [Hirsutella rhossiliensis]KAH0966701.1 hypothetical protein HRG_02110 [Hirsutella rhossiliensis]
MAYTVDGESLSLRDVQVEASACWCGNPAFLTGLETGLEGFSPSSPLSFPGGNARGLVGSLWFTVVFADLDLRRADRVIDDIGLAFPPDSWYYGCREDHLRVLEYGREMVHSCLVILVGCASHGVEVIRNGVQKLIGLQMAHAATVTLAPIFSVIASWVQARIAFINAAGKGASEHGLKRGVFGYGGILAVLRFQFGSASEPLVTEMALAKQISDEEDGIICGGFAPMLVDSDGTRGTIYVATSDHSSLGHANTRNTYKQYPLGHPDRREVLERSEI